jgi:hypothetical protein
MTAHPAGWELAPMASQQYRIVVAGRLSDRLGSAFRDVTLERRPGLTVLHGEQGEAHLESVLRRLNNLGIEPLAVDRHD